jgi:hypothetical protein
VLIRSEKFLNSIAIGKEHNCSIKVTGNKYIFNLNGKIEEMPRASTAPNSVGYKLYPYFGGDELGLDNICIWIKELP